MYQGAVLYCLYLLIIDAVLSDMLLSSTIRFFRDNHSAVFWYTALRVRYGFLAHTTTGKQGDPEWRIVRIQ